MTPDEIRDFRDYVVASLCHVDDILEAEDLTPEQRVEQARQEIARVLGELVPKERDRN